MAFLLMSWEFGSCKMSYTRHTMSTHRYSDVMYVDVHML